jgi:hypothetical protein
VATAAFRWTGRNGKIRPYYFIFDGLAKSRESQVGVIPAYAGHAMKI